MKGGGIVKMEQEQQQFRGVGRPKQSYKHISLITGNPIDAKRFYKEERAFRIKQNALKEHHNPQLDISNERFIKALTRLRAVINEYLAQELKIQSVIEESENQLDEVQ